MGVSSLLSPPPVCGSCIPSGEHMHPCCRSNPLCVQVVFRGGEGALQVLPPLVDVIPEARLNLVIYYLRQGKKNWSCSEENILEYLI